MSQSHKMLQSVPPMSFPRITRAICSLLLGLMCATACDAQGYVSPHRTNAPPTGVQYPFPASQPAGSYGTQYYPASQPSQQARPTLQIRQSQFAAQAQAQAQVIARSQGHPLPQPMGGSPRVLPQVQGPSPQQPTFGNPAQFTAHRANYGDASCSQCGIAHGNSTPCGTMHYGSNSCGNVSCDGSCSAGCQTTIRAVDCANQCGSEGRWLDITLTDFDTFAQGEYAGPPRLAHLADYRLRPADEILFTYVVSRRKSDGDYRLMIGDSIKITLVSDPDLNQGSLERGLEIQPDGYIHPDVLRKPVFAAGLTIPQLRAVLEESYTEFYTQPGVSVQPVKTSTLAEDIRNAVGGASGLQQQAQQLRVTPDGSVHLPWINRVCVQGLTLDEVADEVNARYAAAGAGLLVTPSLQSQAPHFVHVMGRVQQPGRIQLEGPTTVSMAIAAAGSWEPEGNLRQVVVFRRADDWRLMATMLDLRGAFLGKRPTPSDEIWLRDGDVVIVPPTPITLFDNFVRQVFTDGIYRVAPFQGFSVNFGNQN